MSRFPDGTWLWVALDSQCLSLWSGARPWRSWPVATGAAGAGERRGSGATPRGWHRVRARIGAGAAPGTVFVARRPTGERWSPALEAQQPGRDWILTRILWLSGLERGRNRLGEVDTMRRFIYIHGCPDTAPLGRPVSHGCVRMRNEAVMALFDLTPPRAPVWIGREAPPGPPPR